ncbi:MAG: NADP-dependent malic enzyme [Bacteroidales bacterium]|nr:NADP-dependent malic enzyme [Bacteroidales bacterium]MCF8405383.1 NADP-dependent malic enzyme [Bacteroidales bacterium]
MSKFTAQDALNYHSQGRPGKIEVIPTKPHATQLDLSLAYSPGVAEPCLAIEKNPELAFKYTAKGNLVAVLSNGTAVLGLGNIGALAGKPVMEGKGLLFKIFADVDVFDIEVDETDVEAFIKVAKAISPTFGGINLEDIKAPECFEIEERLKKELNIPVFHDDQHGTAIISAAGLINALELVNKKIEDIKVVVNGAGASAISCSKLYISLGVKQENVVMCDTKGVIHKDRTDLNKYKQQFITTRNLHTLAEALVGADVFLGLSVADVMTPEMLKSMAKNPIVFAMANPNPEISYEKAMASRKDLIFATGRSDYPNQINNVLGFPYIFRGALDIRATTINEEMKIAAVKAIAELTKEDVPDTVNRAYKAKNLSFGREYIIPKPLDPRLITSVASAVAKAGMDSGVAGHEITDWNKYHNELRQRIGIDNQLIRDIRQKAKNNPKRIALGEAANFKVLKAAQEILHSGIGIPILIGNKDDIHWLIAENKLDLGNIEIIDPKSKEEEYRRNQYAEKLFAKRQRKGLTKGEAIELMYNLNYFGAMMVETGDSDGFLSGFSSKYADVIRPAIQIAGTNNTENHIAGMYIVQTKKGSFFFADTTVNIQPSIETIVDTTILTARTVERFGVTPRIALLSYSNFGSNKSGSPSRAHEAVKVLHRDYPNLIVDGEMQANFAFNKELRDTKFPFSKLAEMDVNTIIFPNLSSGNIAYKMMQEIGGAEVIGPILMGLGKPIHVLQIESSVREIVNMAAIAVIDAQCYQDPTCG